MFRVDGALVLQAQVVGNVLNVVVKVAVLLGCELMGLYSVYLPLLAHIGRALSDWAHRTLLAGVTDLVASHNVAQTTVVHGYVSLAFLEPTSSRCCTLF